MDSQIYYFEYVGLQNNLLLITSLSLVACIISTSFVIKVIKTISNFHIFFLNFFIYLTQYIIYCDLTKVEQSMSENGYFPQMH